MSRARDNANLGAQAGSGLDASDITSGALPVGVTGGSGLNALSASNLSAGTVPDARFPATLPAASGTNLTALPADELSGTITSGTQDAITRLGTISTALTTTGAFTSVGITDGAVGATAITIDASENVGIGTTSPATPLHLATQTVNVGQTIQGSYDSNANPSLRLRKSNNTIASPSAITSGHVSGQIGFDSYDGNSWHTSSDIYSITSGTVADGRVAGSLVFRTSPDSVAGVSERMRIDSAGDTIIQGNLKIVTDKGINFYGGTDPDTTGTATGNILDDYEEGTWTAAAVCGTSGTIAFYSNWNTGRYTKIGNTVHISGMFLVETIGTPIGSLSITGLPFTAPAGNSNYNALSIRAYAWDVSVNALSAFVGAGAATIGIENLNASSTNAAGFVYVSSYIMIGGSYKV